MRLAIIPDNTRLEKGWTKNLPYPPDSYLKDTFFYECRTLANFTPEIVQVIRDAVGTFTGILTICPGDSLTTEDVKALGRMNCQIQVKEGNAPKVRGWGG